MPTTEGEVPPDVPEAGEPEQRPAPSPAWDEWIKVVPAVAAALAALGYGLFSLTLRQLYAQLSTSPEEVGWDTTKVLVSFVPGYVLGVLLVLGFVLGWLLDTERPGPFRAHFRRALVIGVVVAALVTYLALFVFAEGREAQISRGDPVRVGWDSLVPVATQCVTVLWSGEPPARLEAAGALGEGRAVQRLGQADGTTVLFDASTDSSIRVPTSAVILVEVEGTRCRR